MPILQNIKSCVRRKHGVTRRPTKVHFNVKIVDAFKSANIASQLRDLLVYIAREGVAVTDLFRRPGNIQSIKKIVSDLESGRLINWTDYNFYTLANIAKRFLLHVEGGILGEEAEEALIEALDIPDIDVRNAQMKSIITSQPKMVQQLLTLLFGTWFRMIYHTEVNAMSVEAVAKSVAGSIFPSCTYSPEKVEKASKVMEVLIVGFASTELFGRELIEYFTRETNTSISRVEKFKYEFRFPKNVPKPRSTQMFRQMLIEESKKHGFDILKDEVTKEEFECANETMALDCPELHFRPTNANKDGGGDSLGPTVGSVFIPRTPSLRVPLANLQPTVQSTPAPYPLPPSPRHLIDENGAQDGRLGHSNHLHPHHHRIDRVQQYSEKRTCITATSADSSDSRFRRRDSSGMLESLQGPGERVYGILGRQYDSLSEIDDFSNAQESSCGKGGTLVSTR
ncbi:Rho GTPase-activating protein 20 [Taenia solium]|eukprot:TsM_000421800 transcript=TsM_000421800 gene=TsM_000421800